MSFSGDTDAFLAKKKQNKKKKKQKTTKKNERREKFQKRFVQLYKATISKCSII